MKYSALSVYPRKISMIDILFTMSFSIFYSDYSPLKGRSAATLARLIALESSL